MASRKLTQAERILAAGVFYYSIPLMHVIVTDSVGINGSQYTIGRTINVGPYLYKGLDLERRLIDDPLDNPRLTKKKYAYGSTLIHELVHVWQYEYWPIPSGYAIDSGVNQLLYGSVTPYTYVPGAPWDSYHAEQQAQIIQDWYDDGLRTDSELFQYARTIRAKRYVQSPPLNGEDSQLRIDR